MQYVTRAVTSDEIAVFERDGVVLLKGILNLQAVNSLRMAIDSAVATAAESKSAYNLSRVISAIDRGRLDDLNDLRDGQYDIRALAEMVMADGRPTLREASSQQNMGSYYIDSGVAARVKGFQKIALAEGLGYIAGSLMRSEAIRFFDDQIFVKEPQCADRTSFHQDSTYFHAKGNQTCVFWVPVDPVRDEHGAMQYVRGSHKWQKDFQPNVFISPLAFPGADGEPVPDIEGREDEFDLIQFDVDPGDVIIHHYMTVHGAGANHSRYQVRRAASLRYCGDDMVYFNRPYAPQQSHHVHQLQDGDPLNAACFPLIWSNPNMQKAA
jgi:ectoine hydroxylase-related dioxygenase (phytanoyl-CoA dioxygenase family)